MKKRVIHILLLSFIGMVSYANTFDVPFVYDDVRDITGDPYSGASYLSYFIDPSTVDSVKDESVVRRYLKTRYVGFMSFLVNYRLGGLDVHGFHAVNLAIHISNALLLYLLIMLTFETPALSGSSIKRHSHLMALFSALLFVSHPIQTEAVTYISKRVASIATMFYLLSMSAYAGYRLAEVRGRRYALYAATILSAVLAMKSKEIAFTLPLAVSMYEFMFFRGRVGKRLLLLLPILLTILVVPHAYLTEEGPGDVGSRIEGSTRFLTDMPRTEYLLTQFRVAVTYTRLLFLPINQNLDYDYPTYGTLLEPSVAVSLLFLLAVFSAGLYLLHRSRTNAELRLISFGVFWFFVTLSVESSVIPLKEIMVEYRVYLPGIGAFIALVTAAFIASEKIHKMRTVMIGVLLLLTLSFTVATFARNTVWKDEMTLWTDVVEKSPQNARAHNNLAAEYFSRGLTEEAVSHYRTAVSLNPNYAKAHYNLGLTYLRAGLVDMAIIHFKEALTIDPKHYKARQWLSVITSGQKGEHPQKTH